MAKICTNEKTAARQRWIENGLLELMQEEKFEAISVTDLCRHLGLSRRSFYRYFRDLEDVLDSLMDHTFQDMVISHTILTVRELTEQYRFWLGQKSLLSALSRSGLYGKLVEYTLKYTSPQSLKMFLAPDQLDMDISQEMSLFVVSGLSSLLVSWYAEGFQKEPEQMAKITLRMLSQPLLAVP